MDMYQKREMRKKQKNATENSNNNVLNKSVINWNISTYSKITLSLDE